MRKIELKPYEINGYDERGNPVKKPYDVKGSLANLLFNPDLKLSGRELLQVGKLAEKIEGCQEDNLLLELADYEKLVRAVEVFKGFGKNEVELVRRILDAPNVDVEEKK